MGGEFRQERMRRGIRGGRRSWVEVFFREPSCFMYPWPGAAEPTCKQRDIPCTHLRNSWQGSTVICTGDTPCNLCTPGVQVVEVIDGAVRDSRLHELLGRYHSSRTNRVIVFVLYKKEAARVESFLQRKGWKVGWLDVSLVGSSCCHVFGQYGGSTRESSLQCKGWRAASSIGRIVLLTRCRPLHATATSARPRAPIAVRQQFKLSSMCPCRPRPSTATSPRRSAPRRWSSSSRGRCHC